MGELTISEAEYREGLKSNLAALNALVISSVEEIAEADPNGVIVIFSDHGLRYSLEDADEHFRSFLAARTPGVDRLLADDESTVNILRRFATEYWGATLEPLPYEAWWSSWNATLELSRYPFEQ